MDTYRFITILLFIAVFILLFHLLGRFYIGYYLKEKSIDVYLFHLLLIRRVYYKDIEKIRILNFMDGFDMSFIYMAKRSLNNKIFGSFILIKTKRGILRNITISPNNVNEFAKRIKEGMELSNKLNLINSHE